MALLIKETRMLNWGNTPLIEFMCPSCGSSIIERQKGCWPVACWSCSELMPQMYRHFTKRKMARYAYYSR